MNYSFIAEPTKSLIRNGKMIDAIRDMKRYHPERSLVELKNWAEAYRDGFRDALRLNGLK